MNDRELPKPALWFDMETGHWKVLSKPDRPTYQDYYTAEQMREYAHLVRAAAPDLLASLQVMLRDYAAVHDIGDVEMQPAIYQARAAIAKATGETK
jgi:hypothetical protein